MSEPDAPAEPSGPLPGLPSINPAELADRAVNLVDGVTGRIHNLVVRPVMLAARAVVFGLLIATMSLVVLVAGSVLLVRFCDVYFFGGRVWASDALVGGLACAAGLVAWSFRAPRQAGADGRR